MSSAQVQQPGPAAVGRVGVQPRDRSGPRSRARARARARAPRPGRTRRPRCSTGAGRARCGGGSRGRWGAPGSRCGRSRPAPRSASRSARPPRPAAVSTGSSCSGEPRPSAAVWSTQNAFTPWSARSRSSPGTYAHSGSQNPPPQSPKRRSCDGDPGGQLQAQAGVAGQQRKQRVGGRRGPQLHRASRRSRASAPIRSRLLERRHGAPRSRPRRAAPRRPARARRCASSPRESSSCTARRVSPRKPSSRSPAVARQGLELVAQHRRDAQRDRRLDLARAGRSAAGTRTTTASHSHSSPNGQVPKPST